MLASLALLLAGCESSSPVDALPPDRVTVLGGPGRGEGRLHQPRGLAALPDGSCVVIDRSGWVQRFTSTGEVIAAWVLPEYSEGQPVDLTVTPEGTLLISDTHYSRILECDLEGRTIGVHGEGAGLQLVRGIDISPEGIFYVADYGKVDRVHRFRRDGTHLGSFGSKGEGPGQFVRPEGVAVGEGGDVFVVDCGNHRVLRFDAEGDYLAAFGESGPGPGQFLYPFDIAVGGGDCLYVVDFQGNRVQRFAPDGAWLGAVGGGGRRPGEFATPRGVAVHSAPEHDLVFVADTNNHRVQCFEWETDR